MSALGLGLILLAAALAVLAICSHLDAMEARYQARLDEQIKAWDASQRGSARVVDFEHYLNNKKNGKEAA